jgi:hypothetical protein
MNKIEITDEIKLRAVSLFISTLLYKNENKGFKNLTDKSEIIFNYICGRAVEENECDLMDR